MYYHHQLSVYFNDSKKIWSLIGDAINKRKTAKMKKLDYPLSGVEWMTTVQLVISLMSTLQTLLPILLSKLIHQS
jgi:hypothetical protein